MAINTSENEGEIDSNDRNPFFESNFSIMELETDDLLDDHLSSFWNSQTSLIKGLPGNSRIRQILELLNVHIYSRIENIVIAIKKLWHGPEIPKNPQITLTFRHVQELPDRILGIISYKNSKILLGIVIIMWTFLFQSVAQHSIFAIPYIDGEQVVTLRCDGSTDTWIGKNSKCGLDANLCVEPVNKTMKFKCLSDCSKESWTYSNVVVGDYESLYRSFVIGGDNSYRADSLICAAAVHHGSISDRYGGGGILRFENGSMSYDPERGHNGVESIGFDSEFAQSFSFEDMTKHSTSGCYDYRSIITCFNLFFSFMYGYLVANPAWFYFIQCLCGFWNVILASNPPLPGGSETANAEIVSLALRRLIPLMFTCYVVYATSSKPLLSGIKAHFSRSLFWCTGYWIGILENYVFAYLPIDRLTVSDLNNQEGAWIALSIIAVTLVAIAIGQAYVIWRAGKFKRYISYYLVVLIVLVVLAGIPNETLRLHHYIFALILLPGTGFQTTPALFYNGILVGLLIAGVARWGFDSILQTYDQLRRGAPALEGPIPNFFEPDFTKNGITILWNSTLPSHWTGFSLLINDIERYRGATPRFEFSSWLAQIHTNMTLSELPHRYYFRLAYASMIGEATSDYTRTAVLERDILNWNFPPYGRT